MFMCVLCVCGWVDGSVDACAFVRISHQILPPPPTPPPTPITPITPNQVVERPQYMLLRVALGIHGADLDTALETYELMSNKWFLHASPTLFHAGTRFPQMSSCFLLTMKADSIVGIYDTLKQCAVISKAAGGIGLSVHNIRSHGSYIKVCMCERGWVGECGRSG